MTTFVIDREKQRKSRIKLLLVFATFFGPLLLAFIWLQMVKDDPTIGASSNGQLILPAIPLQPFLLSEINAGEFSESSIADVWSLLTISEGPCEDACQKNLYHMRQVRLSVAQNMDRVQRIVVLENEADFSREITLQHEGLRIVTGSAEQLAKLKNQIKGAESNLPLQRDAIYLIDPHGNLMMRFPNDLDPKGILKDLKHLLKVSRIG